MSATPAASEATEQALELPGLRRLVAQLASCDLGRQRVASLSPFSDRSSLEEHRRRYDDARRLIAARPLVPYREQPIGPLLKAIENSGHALDGRSMVDIAAFLTAASEACGRILEAEPACDSLAPLAEQLPSCDELERTLRKTFDPRGEIRENATPRLAALRARLRRARSHAYQQLGSLAGEHREHLSEETIPLRGGRLVLLLRAGSRGRIPGLLHGRSGRGKSYYFEPLEAVESNNKLQQTVDEEEAERRRILAELIQRLSQELPAVRARAAFVAELDLLQAAVRFAEMSGGHMVEIGGRHELKLVAARHPLLDPDLAELRREALDQAGHSQPIVPLELALTAEKRALVVTGPNAGGKTVALKTLGLLSLAHLCGLPIPAGKGSCLPFLHSIVATVGDDQDLLADRSTFSGRLLRLREAWDAAGPDTLVLLDELGSGTDPEEGAALATALLEGLTERGCLLLVTTHLSQVAAAALETGGAFCAAMQFDAETGRPTYRLLPGPPGGSEALALAHRLGLPRAWLDRAEALLGTEHRDLRRLLAEVERTRQDLGERLEQLEMEHADAAKLRLRLTEQEAQLTDERKTLSKKLERQLETFRQEVQDRLQGEVERLRTEIESGRKRHIASAATGRLFESAPEIEIDDETPAGGPLVVGASVKHRRLGWTGTLDKLDRGRAQVRVAGKSLRCREEDLVTAAVVANLAPRRPPPVRPPITAKATALVSEETPSELKLIGERVEPAIDLLDRFIDRALLASLASVRIIHGHGSGRLREAVRGHLRSHPAVATQRPGRAREGGNGATIASLRDG